MIRLGFPPDATIGAVISANQHRAKAITIINLKGGVGKTHTTWLLAGVCQERSRGVLVVDTDTQGNISRSLLAGGNPLPGIEALFDPRTDADPQSIIRSTRFSNIDLIPASPPLAAYDLSDQRTWERSDLHLSLADGRFGCMQKTLCV